MCARHSCADLEDNAGGALKAYLLSVEEMLQEIAQQAAGKTCCIHSTVSHAWIAFWELTRTSMLWIVSSGCPNIAPKHQIKALQRRCSYKDCDDGYRAKSRCSQSRVWWGSVSRKWQALARAAGKSWLAAVPHRGTVHPDQQNKIMVRSGICPSLVLVSWFATLERAAMQWWPDGWSSCSCACRPRHCLPQHSLPGGWLKPDSCCFPRPRNQSKKQRLQARMLEQAKHSARARPKPQDRPWRMERTDENLQQRRQASRARSRLLRASHRSEWHEARRSRLDRRYELAQGL